MATRTVAGFPSNRRSRTLASGLLLLGLLGAGLPGSVRAGTDKPAPPRTSPPAVQTEPGTAIDPRALTPFGTHQDPIRLAPELLGEVGEGIVSIELIVAGAARIEQQAAADGAEPSQAAGTAAEAAETAGPAGGVAGVADGLPAGPLAGAVVDVRVAAGSTTRLLSSASVSAFENDTSVPLLIACVLKQDDGLSVVRAAGTRIAAWNVAVGQEAFECQGSFHRLAMWANSGGFRLVATPTQAGSARLLLLFATGEAGLHRLEVAGASVKVREQSPAEEPAPEEVQAPAAERPPPVGKSPAAGQAPTADRAPVAEPEPAAGQAPAAVED